MRTGDPGAPGDPGDPINQGATDSPEEEAAEPPAEASETDAGGEPPETSDAGSADGDSSAAQPDPAEIIAALEREKKEAHDRWVRTTADFENYRKRAQRDCEDRIRRSREETLRAILPIADNLERALDHADDTNSDSIHEGVRLVHRQLLGALQKFDVQPFDSVGIVFNPEEHDAVGQEETADVPPGCVVREMQRGYVIGERVLRPAMVTVARPPAPPAESAAKDEADDEKPENGGS